MLGLFRHYAGTRKATKEPPAGKLQTGYLWGAGNPVDTIGEKSGWHWRAAQGQAISYWTLYYGNREIGMTVYPTNETRDWPDLLFQMLLGLGGISDNPLEDDEIDEILQCAKDAAEYVKGFAWLPENRRPKNPYKKGSLQAQMWQHFFNNAYAEKHGSDFLRS